MTADESWQLPNISAGTLKVVLARTEAELENLQKLRYAIYYGEMKGTPTDEAVASQRDFDEFDDFCDHLMVIDTDLVGHGNPVVGTYRLIRGSKAKAHGRFYSESEFDISALKATPGELLELGRSCVREDYRSRATVQLLWRGIGAYMMHYKIQYLFGCASFGGLDTEPLKPALSYLHHHHLAPENIRLKALPSLFVKMDWLPSEGLDGRSILAAMPPLIKGYIKLGCYVGDGAVHDVAANTTDVSIILPIGGLTGKYYARYAAPHEGQDDDTTEES